MATITRIYENTESSVPKYTLAAVLGLASFNSSHAQRFITAPIPHRTSIGVVHKTTSTQVNLKDRYSLDKLILNKRTLSNLRNLNPNWNGYDAEPINQLIINKTESLLSQLPFQPQIFPTGRGTVQIEYYVDDNNFTEIEIFEDSQFMYRVKDGQEEERDVTIEEIFELV